MFYINKYKTHIEHEESNGYNMTIGGDGVKGFSISDETRAKLSAAFSGENHPFYGKHLSDEHKMNCSIAKLGIKKSQSTRKNMSLSKKKPVLQLHKDTLEIIAEYPSIKDAQKITHIEHISQVCNGKRKTAGGFIWKFKD
jgi:outer membrane receptor for monomeric catechols